MFDKIRISNAVWEEITSNKATKFYKRISDFFESKVVKITSFNDLTFLMGYGESESLILYKELKADFLLIDDKKSEEYRRKFKY
ncbi:MAG: hypothetical protein M3015_16615 [Bacteroidota bacterium]|nr:hypothetical protein [Bacteroidota bacterium]